MSGLIHNYQERFSQEFTNAFALWAQALPEDPHGLELLQLFLISKDFQETRHWGSEKSLSKAFETFLERTLPSWDFAKGPHPRKVRGYHAHVYFNESKRVHAERMHQQLLLQNLERIKVSPLFEDLKGPHPEGMFEILFGVNAYSAILSFLERETGPLDVLIHTVTGDDLYDHTLGALWIGQRLDLNFSQLDIHLSSEFTRVSL